MRSLFDFHWRVSGIFVRDNDYSIFNGFCFAKYLRYLSETKKIIPNFVYY